MLLKPLRPPALLRLALAMLLLCVRSAFAERGRSFGATITSASGDSLTNCTVDGCGGVRELTMMFAVEVGERCSVNGYTR